MMVLVLGPNLAIAVDTRCTKRLHEDIGFLEFEFMNGIWIPIWERNPMITTVRLASGY